jgi:alpha/beta superfamily hydrolase
VKTEKTWIECNDARLYAELHTPDAVPAPALLICHGMDSQGFHFLKIYNYLAETACKNGFISLLFDFRGVGKSTGKFDYGIGEQQDVKHALNYLASRPEAQPNNIFIVGHSLGGATSLCALQNEKRVKGLVLWSTPKNHNYNVKKFIKNTRGRLSLYLFLIFSRIDKLIDVSKIFKLQVYGINLRPRYVYEKLMKLDEREAVSKLKHLPILIVIGDMDNIVGKDEAEAIFSAANEPKSLLVVRSADHIYMGKEDELISNTIEWIKKWL